MPMEPEIAFVALSGPQCPSRACTMSAVISDAWDDVKIESLLGRLGTLKSSMNAAIDLVSVGLLS